MELELKTNEGIALKKQKLQTGKYFKMESAKSAEREFNNQFMKRKNGAISQICRFVILLRSLK